MLNEKIRPEDIDDSYCDGCQHKFKKLEDKEKECAECILTELKKQRWATIATKQETHQPKR